MNIDGITQGIVLDHISAGRSMQIYNYLQLDKLDCCVAIIKNVRSSKMGRKDIIKIDADIDVDLDILGYIDPNITVNHIVDGVLVGKEKLELPTTLKNVISCNNPRCITMTEQEIDQIFHLADPQRGLYRCAYCETAYKSK